MLMKNSEYLQHMALQRQVAQKSHIGASYGREEGNYIVTGKIKYACDMELPRMLYGAILRSPHPHANIRSIITKQAENVPGVIAVITAKDLPDVRFGSIVRDRYVLAKDRVRFVGEPVAAVAAETLQLAEDALSLIDVQYEKSEAVFDAEEAISDNEGVLLHPDYGMYQKNMPRDKSSSGTHHGSVGAPKKNVSSFAVANVGDVERAFETADLIFENKFTTARAQPCPMAPHAALARTEFDGGVTVWAESVVPHRLRTEVAHVLQLPPSKVRVVVPTVGGSYGAKATMEVAHICAALSQKSGRPVKIVLSREDEFLTITRHPFTIHIKDGVMRDGTLVARQMRLIINGGAYSGVGHIIAGRSILGALDSYRIPNISVESSRVYTNLPPGGPFRGVGIPQVLWAVEQQMDIIAHEIGMTPADLRKKNILREGDVNGLGERVHNLPLEDCMSKAVQMIDLNSTRENFGDWRYGKGIAIGCKSSAIPTVSYATAVLHPDLSVEVRVSAVEQGQGIRTALRQLAAEELNMPFERVSVTTPDTIFTPYDDGSVSSRSTFVVGNAVREASRNLKEKLLKAASVSLRGSTLEDLEVVQDQVRSRRSKDSIPLKQLFGWGLVEETGEFLGEGTFGLKNSVEADGTFRKVAFYGAIAQGVEVAVNVKTGEIKVMRVVTAVDVGKAINRQIVQTQISGSIVMGLGITLFEEMNFEDGHLLNSGFLDYRLPTVLDLPDRFEISLIESNQVDGPYGAKGVGEIGMIVIGPALANAIYNATGTRIRDHPITSRNLLLALNKKYEEKKIQAS
jgi:CO/xanthine dehydrogenase Mo-binding subunit